jgi:hypothetical protein
MIDIRHQFVRGHCVAIALSVAVIFGFAKAIRVNDSGCFHSKKSLTRMVKKPVDRNIRRLNGNGIVTL